MSALLIVGFAGGFGLACSGLAPPAWAAALYCLAGFIVTLAWLSSRLSLAAAVRRLTALEDASRPHRPPDEALCPFCGTVHEPRVVSGDGYTRSEDGPQDWAGTEFTVLFVDEEPPAPEPGAPLVPPDFLNLLRARHEEPPASQPLYQHPELPPLRIIRPADEHPEDGR